MTRVPEKGMLTAMKSVREGEPNVIGPIVVVWSVDRLDQPTVKPSNSRSTAFFTKKKLVRHDFTIKRTASTFKDYQSKRDWPLDEIGFAHYETPRKRIVIYNLGTRGSWSVRWRFRYDEDGRRDREAGIDWFRESRTLGRQSGILPRTL